MRNWIYADVSQARWWLRCKCMHGEKAKYDGHENRANHTKYYLKKSITRMKIHT